MNIKAPVSVVTAPAQVLIQILSCQSKNSDSALCRNAEISQDSSKSQKQSGKGGKINKLIPWFSYKSDIHLCSWSLQTLWVIIPTPLFKTINCSGVPLRRVKCRSSSLFLLRACGDSTAPQRPVLAPSQSTAIIHACPSDWSLSVFQTAAPHIFSFSSAGIFPYKLHHSEGRCFK